MGRGEDSPPEGGAQHVEKMALAVDAASVVGEMKEKARERVEREQLTPDAEA